MSDDFDKKERVQITTSAVLTKKQQEQVVKELEELEDHQREQALAQEESNPIQRPKVAPWSKSEPLSKIHSILGHAAQGDAYRNELDLVYDRLKGDADAPEYLPSEQDEEDPQAMEALISPAQSPADDPWADGFSFGESAGQVSVQTTQTDPFSSDDPFASPTAPIMPETEAILSPQQSGPKILDGVNLNEFDQLHQTAKSSGTLTSADVNAFLAQQAINELPSDALNHLAGDDVEDWQSIEQHTAPLDPHLIPRRERHPGQAPERFFLSEAEPLEGHESNEAEELEPQTVPSQSIAPLGEPEDTIID